MNESELIKFIASRSERTEEAIEKVIEFCRIKERERDLGINDELGGIEFLYELFKNGIIKLDLYLQLRNVIKNYNSPFTINKINHESSNSVPN